MIPLKLVAYTHAVLRIRDILVWIRIRIRTSCPTDPDSRFFLTVQKDPEPDPGPYLVLMDPDPGGPKTYGTGSATLLYTKH
jgi:hypothetical protein